MSDPTTRNAEQAPTLDLELLEVQRDEPESAGQPEPSGETGLVDRIVTPLDAFQQRHPTVAVPFAVFKKFGDDEAGKLAALISYFAFLSIFPLLIVLATVLSHVLAGNPELAQQIVTTAAGSFLSIGSTGGVQPLDVSGVALVIGVVIALWSGLAVANVFQDAMNTVYEVPKTQRSALPDRVLRSVSLLVIIGLGLPLTTVLIGAAAQLVPSAIGTAAAIVLAVVVNSGLFAVAFRRATVAPTTWPGVLPGAVLSAVVWSALQALATTVLTSRVEGAQSTYGSFAIVVALLFWFFLQAQITLACCELNVVLSERLWPRGLRSVVSGTADTHADVRAVTAYPKREQQASNITVTVEHDLTDAARAPEDAPK